MAKRTQKHRSVRITTPLEEDTLLIKSMTGSERLGRPYQFELVLLSEKHDINYKDVIGQNVTVLLEKAGGEPRFFNGFINRFAQTRFEKELVEYRATIVPWLWFLTRSADCRIFQNLTIPDILLQVFRDHGFTDFDNRLHQTYPKQEYCVQYRETDFNFISRLMEEEGMFYFFKHEQGKHTLVLCDSISSHLQFVGYEELTYRPRAESSSIQERLWTLVVQNEIQSGVYALKDFDFENPQKNLLVNTVVDRGHAAANLEQFDYPGEYVDFSDGERYSRVRIEEQQAQYETFHGEGDARGICTGVRFTLKGHPREDLGREYLTVGTEYRIESDDFESREEATNKFVYEASLTAIDSAQQFRPVRLTPRPVIQGPQTAIVVGPSGEEIYTDKHGRVRLQFHWDRYGKADQNSSCWVRVAQVWAGRKWGGLYLPRIGQEVIVEFLEGDPDRPIVTGRVYNGEQTPPYELPANATMSTLKSLSSKGGQGFNEIRFEDKKGQEQLFVHAEKNQDIRVKNDTFETIENKRHLVVKKDQLEHVENNRHEIVDADHFEQIGKDRHLTVKGKEAIEVGGSLSLTVKGDVIQVFKGNCSQETSSSLYIKAMGVVIEAAQGVTIKSGGNSVVVDGSGVTLTGSKITLDASLVNIASGPGSPAASGSAGSAVSPSPPEEAKEAATADPGEMRQIGPGDDDDSDTNTKPHKPDEEKTSWIEIEMVDEANQPVAGEAYRITLPDGETVAEGTLDEKGFARVDHIDPGSCKITFPNLDKDAWEPL